MSQFSIICSYTCHLYTYYHRFFEACKASVFHELYVSLWFLSLFWESCWMTTGQVMRDGYRFFYVSVSLLFISLARYDFSDKDMRLAIDWNCETIISYLLSTYIFFPSILALGKQIVFNNFIFFDWFSSCLFISSFYRWFYFLIILVKFSKHLCILSIFNLRKTLLW